LGILGFPFEINNLNLLMTWKKWTISFQNLWIKAMELVMSMQRQVDRWDIILSVAEISFGYVSSATCRQK